MPITAFPRKLPADVRCELDDEIRRRGYGDCCGLVEWLANRGVITSKSTVNRYENQLFEQDEVLSADGISPTAARAIVEAAALTLKAIAAIGRALDVLREETGPD